MSIESSHEYKRPGSTIKFHFRCWTRSGRIHRLQKTEQHWQ